MSVRREGETGIFPLEMGLRIEFFIKPDVSSSIPINVFISYHESIFTAITLNTAQDPGSLFWCQAMMSLQFTHVRSFVCGGRLQKLRADCSTVGLYCVTITWQRIF